MAERMHALGRAAEFACPQLSERPAAAMESVRVLTFGLAPETLTLIGSSLGGFYVTWLAEKLGCRAVLINPAMRAHEKLACQVGMQTAYHDATASFAFLPEYLDQLRDFHVAAITRPERYFLLAATGDEMLDWREMVGAFPGARHRVIEGSDHGMSDFADYLGEVLAFAGVAPAH